MKRFRQIAMILAAVLLSGVMVSAQAESKAMKDVLVKVKSVISVPQEYTDFSYSSRTDSLGTVYWQFNWSGEKKGNIDVSVAEDGFIQSYYSWAASEQYNDSLARFTHREAKEIAEEFIRSVNPEIYPRLREVILREENRSSRTAGFYFQEYIGEIPVYQNIISVTVDKYLGMVRNYQGIRATDSETAEKAVLSEEEAKAAYVKQIGLQLEYQTYYQYREKEMTVFPAYRLKNAQGKGIDAVSGEILEPYYEEDDLLRDMAGEGSLKNEAAAQLTAAELSPAELDAIGELKGIYPKEKALGIATEKIAGLSGFSLKNAVLNKDYRDDEKLYWNFSLQNEKAQRASVTLDAKNGTLIGFSLPSDNQENHSLTKEMAQKKAEAFLKKEAGVLFEQSVCQEEPVHNSSEKFQNTYWFTYVRRENGIPVNANQLSIRVDASENRVGYYSCSWDDKLVFPAVSDCMTAEEMLNIMDSYMNFSLCYMKTKDGYRLVYTFLQPDTRLFDPFSGNILNYDGTEAVLSSLPEYQDLEEHWAKAMILTLLDNGYYIAEERFRPDDAITKKEFLQLFQMIHNEQEETVKELICEIEESETADPDSLLTKELAGKYLMHRLGYQRVAQLDSSYVYPFSDAEETERSLIGDITIAAGLGIFKGDADGRFYPKKNLSRAEAASIIYHFFKVQ